MIQIHELNQRLDLDVGEHVVALTSHRGALYAITNYGKLFCIETYV